MMGSLRWITLHRAVTSTDSACFSRNLLTGRSIPFILKNSVSPACDCVYSTAFSSTQWPRLAVSTGAI